MPTKDKTIHYVLDTHIFIWLMNGDKTLSNPIIKRLTEPTQSPILYLPAISLWEIGMLEKKKRIVLKQPILEWIKKALQAPTIELAPLEPKIAVESAHLPGDFHGDPADRMIVATTRVYGATLLTRDKKILDYGQKGYVKCIKS